MAISSDSIGLLFRCKGDTDEARVAFDKFRGEVDKDAQAIAQSFKGTNKELSLMEAQIKATENALKILKQPATLSNLQKELSSFYTTPTGGGVTNLQKGLREAATEASNFVGILTGNRLTGATSQLSSLSALISGMPGPLGLAAGAVGILTTAFAGAVAGGVALLKGLFDITEQAATYGSEIKDASDKTGLHAQTLLTLKTNAEQSGLSFEAVTAAVGKFNVLLGQSNEGNDKAAATLKKYNITAKDTEGALAQAIKRITEMKTADEQAVAAKELFRDRSGEVLKLIKQMDGDLPGAIQKLRDMGVVMSDEDAQAADEFGDTMTALKGQLSAVEFTIGRQLMPTFLNMARSVSAWLSQHQRDIRLWATEFAIAIERVLLGLETVVKWIQNHQSVFKALAFIVDPLGANKLVTGSLNELQTAANDRLNRQDRMPAEGNNVPGFKPVDEDVTKDADKAAKERQAAAEKRAKEQADLLKRDLRANLEIETTNLKDQKQALEETMKELREQFLKDGDFNKFAVGVVDAWGNMKRGIKETVAVIENYERAQLGADALESEKAALAQKQQERRNDLVKEGTKIQKENIDTVTKQAENWEKHLKELLEVDQQLIDKEKEAGKAALDRAAAETAAIDQMNSHFGEFADQLLKAENLKPEIQDGLFKPWKDSWDDFFKTVDSQVGTVQASLGTLAHMLEGAFERVADALGSVVENYVLYGKTGPAVMRMVLAQALASLAAEAAVWAIKAAALGFFYLAVGDFASATLAFESAALWAIVAAGAAITGRAVAGNLFNKQNQGAYGTAGQSASSGQNSNAGSEGSSYSSKPDEIIDTSRNMPFGSDNAPARVHLTVAFDAGGVLQLVRSSIQKGMLRDVVIDAATQS